MENKTDDLMIKIREALWNTNRELCSDYNVGFEEGATRMIISGFEVLVKELIENGD